MKAKADDYAKTLSEAVPLTSDVTTIETSVMRVEAVIEQLQTLTKHIKRYESQLKQLLPQHGDYAIVKSLPGAAFNMQARIIAALGDDRSRYPDAASLQAASGIAPVQTHRISSLRLVEILSKTGQLSVNKMFEFST
jgi:transposase